MPFGVSFVLYLYNICYNLPMSSQNLHQEPHDDRWHYLDDRDEKHTENYIEWKYFNFTQPDLVGYIIYYIFDPEKKTKLGGGRLLVRIFKDGVSYGMVKKIEMDQIELDTVSASLRMGGAKITEKDSYHYDLECKLKDIAWNLNFKQDSPSIESYRNIHTGLMRWEKINWLVKMPRAEVRGEVRIGEKTFEIDALGYSDTNWGEMMPFFTKYEWGQYNEKSFSLVFGVLYVLDKIKSTYFYIILGEHLIRLEKAQCEVKHLEWKNDEAVDMKIPSHSTFFAREGEYEVKFSTKLLFNDDPGIELHPLLPKVIVSEQIVEFEGIVSKNGEVLHSFKGRGFQEWPGKTWKEPPVPF